MLPSVIGSNVFVVYRTPLGPACGGLFGLGAYLRIEYLLPLWHDRDLDVVYLVKTWAVREQTPLDHAQALRSWKLTFAWPA